VLPPQPTRVISRSDHRMRCCIGMLLALTNP
jgi:hypothetical protein